jgi:hypothetical protein
MNMYVRVVWAWDQQNVKDAMADITSVRNATESVPFRVRDAQNGSFLETRAKKNVPSAEEKVLRTGNGVHTARMGKSLARNVKAEKLSIAVNVTQRVRSVARINASLSAGYPARHALEQDIVTSYEPSSVPFHTIGM